MYNNERVFESFLKWIQYFWQNNYYFTILYIDVLLESQSVTETIPETPQAVTPVKSDKPKVVVQQVGRVTNVTEEDVQKANIANGLQPSSQSAKEGSDSSPNKFILTPDYIQQS